MDEFQEKRNMVQMLMKMLKQSSADEMSSSLSKPPEGMPGDPKGLELEKISVMPGHKEDIEMSPEMESEMGDHAPEEKPAMPHMDDADHNEPMPEHDDESEDRPSSPFASLMKKKFKK